MSDFRRKCPLCAGEMIRSQKPSSESWKMPGKSRFLQFGAERTYPWACMACGVVLLYLERVPSAAEELEREREKEASRSIAPAPLKS